MKVLSTIAGTLVISSACLLTSCTSSTETKSEGTSTTQSSAYHAEKMHDGRFYLIGNKTTELKFSKTHHLPYTDTRIGAGPGGETVIIEVDKEDPTVQKRLWEKFQAKHLYYSEISHDGRTYIVGSKTSEAKFKKSPHLPYAQTMIGAGAKGETVVIEIDKSQPNMQKRLWNEYKAKHFFYAEEAHHGRIYVIGKKETYEAFKKSPHLPICRTLIGAGPDGETIVFEIDKSNPVVMRSLVAEFNQRYGTSLN